MTASSFSRLSERHDLTVPWPLVALVLMLAIVLSLFTRGANTLSIDRETTRAVQGLDGQPWQALADIGNWLGDSTVAVVVAVVLIAIAAVRRDVHDGAFLFVLLILRSAATALKGLFDSPRPSADVAELLEVFEHSGFPSGHAITGATALGGIAFLAARHARFRTGMWALPVTWVLGMAMVGYARIWVGAHWLTDVVGGSLFGMAIVFIAANTSAIVADALAVRRERKGPSVSL